MNLNNYIGELAVLFPPESLIGMGLENVEEGHYMGKVTAYLPETGQVQLDNREAYIHRLGFLHYKIVEAKK